MRNTGQAKWFKAGARWKKFVWIASPTILFGVLVGILGDALKGEQLFAHWLFHLGCIARPYEKAFDALHLWYGQIAILLILCIVLGWWLFEALPKEKPIKVHSEVEGLGKRQALVYCVSTSPWRLEGSGDSLVWRHGKKTGLAPYPVPTSLPEALLQCDEMQKEGGYVSLQQLLRLIQSASAPGSLRIELVCSEQTLAAAHDIRKLLEHLGLASIDIQSNLEALDTESVSEVYDYLDKIVTKLTSKQIPQSAIVIDVTSGQKPYSIAAAAITLHNHMWFSYVSTTDSKVMVGNMYYDNRSSIG